MIRILLVIFALFTLAQPAMAQAVKGTTDSNTTDTTGTTGGNAGGSAKTCDFDAFKNALGNFEGGSKQYQAENQFGYLGRYQFGKGALQDLGYKNSAGNWTGKDGINSTQEFKDSPQVQEKAANSWFDILNKRLGTFGLEKYIGQQCGKCKVTRSGLIAAQHLKGIGTPQYPGLKQFLESGCTADNKDANGTAISKYMCDFGGYATPYDSGDTAAGTCGGGSGTSGSPGQTHGDTPATDIDGNGGYGPPISASEDAEGLKNIWVASLMLMAEQFTANMTMQVEGIGMLLDAKHQLETQRLFQQLVAQAHKDYQPSEQMCTFGTFARDLAPTERNVMVTHMAIAQETLQRELGEGDTKAVSEQSDSLTRISQFVKRFCNPGDNGNGLKNFCPTAAPTQMQNRDINYTTTLDSPLSLKINMTDTETTEDEEAVFALVDNLFMHDPTMRITPKDMELPQNKYHYMNLRSIIAMRGIARNTISTIIAMKSETPNKAIGNAPFLKALMVEFGMDQTEINKFLGDNPSYYAQMELLTKKIYQNPTFYTQLYDKPTNVKRISAAMEAIKLMQDRDIQNAMQRREMLLSVMLELRLRAQAETVYDAAEGAMFERN